MSECCSSYLLVLGDGIRRTRLHKEYVLIVLGHGKLVVSGVPIARLFRVRTAMPRDIISVRSRPLEIATATVVLYISSRRVKQLSLGHIYGLPVRKSFHTSIHVLHPSHTATPRMYSITTSMEH